MSTSSREPVVMSSGHSFLESARWHEGRLWASDFHVNRVLRWRDDDDSEPEVVCEVDHKPSGLGWTPDGDLLVISMTDRRLLRLERDELVEVAELAPAATWHANDMVVDAAGRAYVGNFGWDEEHDPVIKPAVLQRVDPDGTVTVVAEDLMCPNGMALTPDERTLFVNESFAARVSAFDVAADGSLSNRRVWASFTDATLETVPEALADGAILPDGMTLDAEGAIWLADCHGQGVTRVAAGGEVLERISTAPHAVFSCTLGGADLRTLYLCTTFPYGAGDPRVQHESTMRRVEVDVPGAGLP